MDVTTTDAGIAVVRIATGLTLAAHGYGKVFLGGRLAGTARWFESIGMRPGRLHARMAAATELGAGIAFAVGLVTPLAALAVVSLMVVAAWTVHRANGFFIVGNGWEYNFILAAVAVAVAVVGTGRLSLDHAVGTPSTAGWAGFVIAGIGGLAAGAAHLAAFFRPPVAATAGN